MSRSALSRSRSRSQPAWRQDRLRSRATLPVVLTAVSLTAVSLTGCASPSQPPIASVNSVGTVSSAFHGTLIDPPYALPAATWTETSGKAVTWPGDGLPTPVTVVIFAYTHCPDVCNTQLADVAQAIRRLDPAVRPKVTVALISVDPRRDTAAAIREYLDRFDPSFVGLRSSDTAMVEQTAISLGVGLAGRSATDYGYTVGHGAALIGFSPRRTAPVIWLPGTAVGDLRDDLMTLAGMGG